MQARRAGEARLVALADGLVASCLRAGAARRAGRRDRRRPRLSDLAPDERRVLSRRCLYGAEGGAGLAGVLREPRPGAVHAPDGGLSAASPRAHRLAGGRAARPMPRCARAFAWWLAMLAGAGRCWASSPHLCGTAGCGLAHQLGAVVLWVLILRARAPRAYPRRHNLSGERMTAFDQADGLSAHTEACRWWPSGLAGIRKR